MPPILHKLIAAAFPQDEDDGGSSSDPSGDNKGADELLSMHRRLTKRRRRVSGDRTLIKAIRRIRDSGQYGLCPRPGRRAFYILVPFCIPGRCVCFGVCNGVLVFVLWIETGRRSVCEGSRGATHGLGVGPRSHGVLGVSTQ